MVQNYIGIGAKCYWARVPSAFIIYKSLILLRDIWQINNYSLHISCRLQNKHSPEVDSACLGYNIQCIVTAIGLTFTLDLVYSYRFFDLSLQEIKPRVRSSVISEARAKYYCWDSNIFLTILYLIAVICKPNQLKYCGLHL